MPGAEGGQWPRPHPESELHLSSVLWVLESEVSIWVCEPHCGAWSRGRLGPGEELSAGPEAQQRRVWLGLQLGKFHMEADERGCPDLWARQRPVYVQCSPPGQPAPWAPAHLVSGSTTSPVVSHLSASLFPQSPIATHSPTSD